MSIRRSDVEHIARWVENDTIAMSHQSLGVYRRELLKTIRAALAQPETAEPVAWQARYIGPDAQTNQWSLCTAADADELVKRPDTYQVRPLYAHPPRDEWRPASEPQEGSKPHAYLMEKLAMVMPLFQEARDALTAITEQQRIARGISPTLADRMDAAGTYSVDDWRDVQPPTEGAK